MCAHDMFVAKAADAARILGLDFEPEEPIVESHWPMRPRTFVRESEEGRILVEANWGLIPSWAKDTKIGRNAFNARRESLIEGKPMFRGALKSRRCLLPATSYVEWRTENGRKRPYTFMVDDGDLYACAGLWEVWGEGAERIVSCTMITTTPNELAEAYHNRMPAILRREDYATWLDPATSHAELLSLLEPFDASRMTAVPADEEEDVPKEETPKQAKPRKKSPDGDQGSLF